MRTKSSFAVRVLIGLTTAGLSGYAGMEAAAYGEAPPRREAADRHEPLPGQIVRDPDHPQWLKRHGGKHVFICGPGDPEDFLYLGSRNSDGTRDGDQRQRIEKLVRHGGNCIYLQVVRSHGGDAKSDRTQNPFVDSDPAKGIDKDILNQWEEWFTLMDRNDILIYLFFYDDGALVWDTGDAVGTDEKVFLEAIVHKFQHHKNLIWVVGEESEEKYSTARQQAIAEIIRAADDHDHLLGTHHLDGTTFKAWRANGAIDHFALQLGKTDDEAHQGAIEALRKAAGRYQIIYSESTAQRTDSAGMRQHAWSVAMAGLMPMLLEMDIAGTPVESLQQCRYLQTLFESTDFWTMTSHDDLAHAGTKYVLADPGRSYIIYADRPAKQLGIRDLPAGPFTVTWLDCRNGQTRTVGEQVEKAGDTAFAKPREIGDECAAWIRCAPSATSAYFPPPESKGGWRKLDKPEDIRRLAGMDSDKLTDLKKWLLQSDKRDFAAVVIRNGYIVLEVERGNSAKTDSRRVASVSKAVCATVLAIAAEHSQRGLTPKRMTFDDPAFNFIPWAHPLSDPRKAKITVKQLLNHTSGICPEANGARIDGTWEYILGHSGDPKTAKLAFDPGGGCGYSTHAFHHAALVCETVTGKPYDEYAVAALFKPIGCEKWWFRTVPGDEKYGKHASQEMGMPARDLARIAYCMLRDGRWEDRQVIPKWFVEETAEPTHNVQTPELRWGGSPQTYSHGWELPARIAGRRDRSNAGFPPDARYKPGSGGQLIAFVPSLDLVVTRQTGSSGEWQYDDYLRRACQAVRK